MHESVSLGMTAFPEIYFPFADGAWSYNCAECGSKCCKGKGFGATSSEFVQLKRRYPLIELFASPSVGDNNVNLSNLADNCFFLEGNGYCRIQVEHGHDAKPMVCKTFPLNRYRLCAESNILIVSPNSLCPIKKYTGQPGDYQIRHADLVAEIAKVADGVLLSAQGRGATGNAKGQTTHKRTWTPAVVAFEVWCRDFVPPAGSSWSPLAYHAAALTHYQGTQALPSLADLDVDEVASCHASMVATMLKPAEALHLPPPPTVVALRDENLLSLTALLRCSLLDDIHSLEAAEILELTPGAHANLALFVYEAAQLSGRALTLAETTSIVHRFRGAAALLRFLDDAPWMEEVAGVESVVPANISPAAGAIINGCIEMKRQPLRTWLKNANANTSSEILSTLGGLWQMRTWLRFG